VNGVRQENESTKSQAPNDKQVPSTNDPMTKTKARSSLCPGFCLGHWNLELGIYLGFGICDLEFYAGGWRESLHPGEGK
jgi:hypothetical protein